MKLWPKWTALQWTGSAMMFASCVAAGILIGSLIPASHAVPSVPLDQLGLAADHAEKAQIVAASMPKFRLVGDAAADDNTKKNVRLWDAVIQLRGSHLPNVPQEIGDCVSWGAANAVNYLQAVQLVRGPPDSQPDEFHPAYPPWIYGASRVWVGQKHGSRFRGDGSVGAYAAEALNTYGCLRSDHAQCPPYSGSVARDWGAKGPPDWARDVAKPYLVQTVSPVTSADEARSAICNGYPVTIASGWWGTTDIPVVDGRRVARRTTSWGHQQCLIAYDGSGSEPLFYCLNSWGPNAHPAPMQGEPPGGYWIRFKDVDHITNEGDSWALSSFDGFPAAGPNWDELLRRPATSSAPIVPKVDSGDEIMSPGIGLGICMAIAIVGLVLFKMVQLRRPIVHAGLACAIGCSGYAVHAQDFDLAARRDARPTATQATNPSATTATATNNQPITVTKPIDWGTAQVRQAQPVQSAPVTVGSIPWMSAQRRVVSEVPKAQALVFFKSFGCSDCTKELHHLITHVMPLGWTMSYEPDADFVLVDIDQNPALAKEYEIEFVPVTIYLDTSGKITERREGFQADKSLTAALKALRTQ